MKVAGNRSQQLFSVAPNHSRLYLPELLVLHIDEYTKQKQENNTREAKEAKKWGMSVEEYRAQKDNRPILINNEGYEIIQREEKRKQSLEDYMYEVIERGFRMFRYFTILFPFILQIEIQDQPVSLPYHPVHENIPHLGYPSLQKIPDSSQTSPHSQDGNLDQISSGLAIGSMVQTTSRGGAPLRGVLKWIGIVPNYEGYVAGVELVSNTKNNYNMI